MDTPLSERPLGLQDEINGRRRRSAAGKRNTKKGGGATVPPLSANYQTSFAVDIFTPGPIVEAATQLRIY